MLKPWDDLVGHRPLQSLLYHMDPTPAKSLTRGDRGGPSKQRMPRHGRMALVQGTLLLGLGLCRAQGTFRSNMMDCLYLESYDQSPKTKAASVISRWDTVSGRFHQPQVMLCSKVCDADAEPDGVQGVLILGRCLLSGVEFRLLRPDIGAPEVRCGNLHHCGESEQCSRVSQTI